MPRPGLRGLCIVLLVAGLAGLGPAKAEEPQYPPASRVGIVPPKDFVPSAAFPGFQHNSQQAQILVGDLPAPAYAGLEKELAAEIERNPGLAERLPITLKDGIHGFVLKGRQTGPQGDVLKWMLVATDNNVTAIVSALIPEGVKEVAPEPAILASFASLTIRASVPVAEQLSVLPFALRNLAGFRIARVQPGVAAMLADTPDKPIDGATQPILLISIAPASQAPEPPQRDGFARMLFGDTPGLKEMQVVRSEPLRIANQQGHELLIDAKDANTGADLKAVQWLRFGSGTLLRIVGISRKEGWSETFNRFRQVRDGIGPRE